MLLETYNLLGNNINKEYTLWYNRPAFNRGGDFTYPVARGYAVYICVYNNIVVCGNNPTIVYVS